MVSRGREGRREKNQSENIPTKDLIIESHPQKQNIFPQLHLII